MILRLLRQIFFMDLSFMKYVIILSIFIVLKRCPVNGELLLGRSLYIPKEDLLGSIPNGIVFYQNISLGCFGKIDNPTLSKGQSYYKDTETLFRSIATETSLSGQVTKVFSLGVTLDATTKSISGEARAVSGTSLNIARKEFDRHFTSTCLYQSTIQNMVLQDFADLPTAVERPWFKESWREYETFLHAHGSHVITSVTYGSSIDQYAFAEESAHYTEKQLTVKACAALPLKVIGAAGLSLSACSGMSKEDMENVTSAKMTTSITIRGGSVETRNRLISDQSADVILKFLSEGVTDPAPIRYKLTPIWQVLINQKQVRDSNSKRSIQAANLQYYFEGFLNFGCPYIPADERGPLLQVFNYTKHSKPERPAFECSIAPEGCHHKKDCHRKIFGCRCYGKSCIRHKTVDDEQAIGLRLVAEIYKKKDWGGDKTCGKKNFASGCICKHERLNRKVIFG